METIKILSSNLNIDCSYEQYHRFRRNLAKLLSLPSKKTINQNVLEKQIDELLEVICKFNPNKQDMRYRTWHKKGVVEFIPIMKELLEALHKVKDEQSYIELKLNLNTYKQPESRFLKLPISPRGNAHFLLSFEKFILEYYESNPPFKYYRGLDPKLSLDYFNQYQIDEHKPNDKLIEGFKFAFHLRVLNLVRQFPQFSTSKRANSILSEKEAKFLINFLEMINYEFLLENGFKFIKPKEIEYLFMSDTTENIKKLRYGIKSYLERIEESNSH